MVHKFEITDQTPGFDELPEWWVSYDDSVITWRPVAPYLFEDDQTGGSILQTARKLLEFHAMHGPTFTAAHPGVDLPCTFSNPHTALYFLNSVAPFEEPDEDSDEFFYDEYDVTFSKNAPRLIAIFGPSKNTNGDEIIY